MEPTCEISDTMIGSTGECYLNRNIKFRYVSSYEIDESIPKVLLLFDEICCDIDILIKNDDQQSETITIPCYVKGISFPNIFENDTIEHFKKIYKENSDEQKSYRPYVTHYPEISKPVYLSNGEIVIQIDYTKIICAYNLLFSQIFVKINC
jgi:hypothetical protein